MRGIGASIVTSALVLLCGGIAASLARRPAGGFIGPWVELLSPIREELETAPPDPDPVSRQKRFEQMAVRFSLDNLAGYPFVKDAIERGHLGLHGAWSAIAEGKLEWFDVATGMFEPVGS